jgi:hypothetical protein
MITEKEIVYSILNSLRGGHSNNNESISIRLIRSFIANERANLLLQFTDAGRSINEENFQSLSTQVFTKVSDNIYKKTLPKIMFFNKRSGVRLRTENVTVLMCTKSQDRNYQKDTYFKSIPRAWSVGTEMYIRSGNGIAETLNLDIDAVLFYPGESTIYNWEVDSFPLQSELLTVLKEMIIKKEQNIVNNRLHDETNNFKSDNETA